MDLSAAGFHLTLKIWRKRDKEREREEGGERHKTAVGTGRTVSDVKTDHRADEKKRRCEGIEWWLVLRRWGPAHWMSVGL